MPARGVYVGGDFLQRLVYIYASRKETEIITIDNKKGKGYNNITSTNGK